MIKLVIKTTLLASVLLAASSVSAVEYSQVLAEKSAINFGYKQMGVPLEGKFKKFASKVVFDPAKPEAASASFDIELASIDTGSSEADDEVVNKEWFNAKAYPVAKFVSSGVKPLGGNRYEVQGKLTIKGKTLPVTAPFTYRTDATNGIFDGSLTIKRLDYAIGEGEWKDVSTVANEIQIKFHIVAAAKK